MVEHNKRMVVGWMACWMTAGLVPMVGAQQEVVKTETQPATASAPASAATGDQHADLNDRFLDADAAKWEARWESESREIFRRRHDIVKALGLKRGMSIADIGAGTGLFSRLLAEAVGSQGKVFAVDISQPFLDHIKTLAAEQHITNIKTVLCNQESTGLASSIADLAFVCDTYHHFEHPADTLRSIHEALKPGGQLVVIDFRRIPGSSREWVLNHVRADRQAFTAEIEKAGFALVEVDPPAVRMDEQYFLRFRKIPRGKVQATDGN